MKTSRVLLPLLVAALVSACSREAAPLAKDLPAASVSVVTVRAQDLPVITEVTGSVRPVQRAVIAAQLMGSISELPVSLGQELAAGELLVRLQAPEVAARVAQAQVGLDQAQRELTRERELLPRGATTAETVRSLEERLAGAQAMLREAQAMQDYTSVRAPFKGVVSRKFVTAGDLAAPGQPLLEIEGTDQFEIELGIPDSLASSLAAGTPLVARIPSSGVSFKATLRELSSASDAQARTVTAKLAIPAEARVRSGQFVRVQVPGPSTKVILVPTAALSHLGQMERVFAVDNGRAQLQLVRTGAVRGEETEVFSGLTEGDTVIVSPGLKLRDGQPVEVRK